MFRLLTWTLFIVLLLLAGLTYSFLRNLRACKASGLPVVCLPFYPHSIIATVSRPAWHPVLGLIPKRYRGQWFIFLNPTLLWDELYAPFRQLGSDTVLICCPTAILMHSCDAEVIDQIVDRRSDFPKPVGLYSIIDSEFVRDLSLDTANL